MEKSYVMQVAEAVRDAVIEAWCCVPIPTQSSAVLSQKEKRAMESVALAAVIASVPVPTDDAAARIAELERQLEQSKNINKQLMLNRDSAFAECRAKTILECAEIADYFDESLDIGAGDEIRALGEKK